MTAVRKSMIPPHARALGFTAEFLAHATRRAIVILDRREVLPTVALQAAARRETLPMPPKMRTPPGPAGLTVFPECDCSTPITAKQPLTQQSPDARSAAVAEFLLATATSLGVKVGYSGDEIITVSMRVPLEVIYALERALVANKQAVIAAIQADVAARARGRS